MANSDIPDYLLKQDTVSHVDIGYLCVERLCLVLRNPLLSGIVSSCPLPAIKQATHDKTVPEPEIW